MNVLERVINGLVRRGSLRALDFLEPMKRAEFVEAVTEGMIIDASISGESIKFYAPYPSLIYRSWLSIEKEPDTIRWIRDFEENAVFWDVGANVGLFSLFSALKKNCSVLAFELAVANYYALSKNIALNKLEKNISAYCLAFSRTERLGKINLCSLSMGAATNQFGDSGDVSPYSERGEVCFEQGMLGFSIDGFVRQFAPPFPKYLKIDVDGLELDILRGAVATLSDRRLESALVELRTTEQGEEQQASELFCQAGLVLAGRGELQSSGKEKGANYLFRRA
jgi:FkbM family methyltransferase